VATAIPLIPAAISAAKSRCLRIKNPPGSKLPPMAAPQ
jgi:hypothetical protein